ncbi:hypothetical protein B0A48_18169 [Cryoendolithus antarcticus]|uniref:F-box domain-containing protein n=1 Tax=Cryoendolithus antarcticus TaxID=1507870 RepID=A0A1V8S9G3_9PEZI|nr:hypothetical protein B0A48_18169 [Cryoendolithus antarcticus]
MEVFNLPELLELILPHLDMKTLLFAQGVNIKFKSTIENSADCQDKLFFRLEAGRGKDGNDMLNPMVVKNAPSTCDLHEQTGNCACKACTTKKWTFNFDVSKMSKIASARRMVLSWSLREHCLAPGTDMQFIDKTPSGEEIMCWRVRDPVIHVIKETREENVTSTYGGYTVAFLQSYYGNCCNGAHYGAHYGTDAGNDLPNVGDVGSYFHSIEVPLLKYNVTDNW